MKRMTLLMFAAVALCAQTTPSYLEEKAATIASGASLSGAIDLQHKTPVMLLMPTAWTSASITFQCAVAGIYRDLYDQTGTEKTLTVAASRAVILPPADFIGCKLIKIRSGTSGSPVTQGADRGLQIVVKPL